MPVTNSISNTRVDEVADSIFRIHTPAPPSVAPGGFSFNQYLLVDDAPLLFHTGPRSMFPLVREAIATVLPVERLRWIAFSHNESDENGALADFLDAAPQALPLSGGIYAMIDPDLSQRPPKALADGETLSLGRSTVRWMDAAHVPHAWECGFLFEERTRTLFAGDLFTQGGSEHVLVTEADILEPAEAFRKSLVAPALGTGAARSPRGPQPGDARVHARRRVARGLHAPASRARGGVARRRAGTLKRPWRRRIRTSLPAGASPYARDPQ